MSAADYPRFMVAVTRRFITVRSPEYGQDGLTVFWTRAAARKIARRTPGAVVEATQVMFVEAVHKAHEMGVPWLYVGSDLPVGVDFRRVPLALPSGSMRSMVSTGEVPSTSALRGMREPVTTTVSRSSPEGVSWAKATPVPARAVVLTSANEIASRSLLVFKVISLSKRVLGVSHGNLPTAVKKDAKAGQAGADSSPTRRKIKVSLTRAWLAGKS